MAIKRLREIIDEQGYVVNNIVRLEVTPRMPAKDLQEMFDKNVDSLISAIDDTENGLIRSIADNIEQAGGGDMSTTNYANGINPEQSTYPVDKALFANTLRVRVANEALYLGENEGE